MSILEKIITRITCSHIITVNHPTASLSVSNVTPIKTVYLKNKLDNLD